MIESPADAITVISLRRVISELGKDMVGLRSQLAKSEASNARLREVQRWSSADLMTCFHRVDDYRVTYKGGTADCPGCRGAATIKGLRAAIADYADSHTARGRRLLDALKPLAPSAASDKSKLEGGQKDHGTS